MQRGHHLNLLRAATAELPRRNVVAYDMVEQTISPGEGAEGAQLASPRSARRSLGSKMIFDFRRIQQWLAPKSRRRQTRMRPKVVEKAKPNVLAKCMTLSLSAIV
jgi:hypothetical protein